MELTQCINYLLTTAQHTVFQYLSGKLSEYDLTPSQYGVLSCLWQREFATPTEKGKAFQEHITKITDDVNEEVLKCFTEEEVAALKNALRIIADGSHFK